MNLKTDFLQVYTPTELWPVCACDQVNADSGWKNTTDITFPSVWKSNPYSNSCLSCLVYGDLQSPETSILETRKNISMKFSLPNPDKKKLESQGVETVDLIVKMALLEQF